MFLFLLEVNLSLFLLFKKFYEETKEEENVTQTRYTVSAAPEIWGGGSRIKLLHKILMKSCVLCALKRKDGNPR